MNIISQASFAQFSPSISTIETARPQSSLTMRVERESDTASLRSQDTLRPVFGVSKTSSTRGSYVDSERDSIAENQNADIARKKEEQQAQIESKQIKELSARDREVRAHEQAHAAVGGQYAGAPRYQFQRGPNGVSYAVGGEVSIDVAPAATAEETIRKMQIVRAAALAPAEPSAQDRRVAAQASATLAQAQAELAAETREEQRTEREPESDEADTASSFSSSGTSSDPASEANETASSNNLVNATVFESLSTSLRAASGENYSGRIISYRV